MLLIINLLKIMIEKPLPKEKIEIEDKKTPDIDTENSIVEAKKNWEESDKKVKAVFEKFSSASSREESDRIKKEELLSAIRERSRMGNLYEGMRNRRRDSA